MTAPGPDPAGPAGPAGPAPARPPVDPPEAGGPTGTARGTGGTAGTGVEGTGSRPPSLRAAALSGGRLGAVSAGLSQLLSVATTVALARLLTPHDIGVVASATIVIGLFEFLVEVGLGASLVQRDSVDRRVLSTMFWSSIALGLFVAAAGAGTAPLTASMIGNRDVAPYIAAVAAITAAAFASVVPGAILQRDLRYGAIYGGKIAAAAGQSLTAIALAALTGLGAWSIVAGRLVQVAVEWVWVTGATRWRPSLEFDTGVVRRGVRFSAGYWGNTLASYVSKNADYWLVGRTAGSGPLGLYYVAFVLPNVVRQRMTVVAQDVLFPLLTRVQGDRERLANAYVRTAQLVTFVAYPTLLGIAVLSNRVVNLFFGSNWQGAVVPMRVLAVAAAVEVLTPLGTVVFLARGEPARNLAVNGVRLAVLAIGLGVAAAVGGLTAVAAAVLASSLAAAAYGQIQVTRRLGIPVLRVAGAVLPMAGGAVAMVVVVRAGDVAVPWAPGSPIALAVLVALGTLVYAAAGLLLFRPLFRSFVRDVAEMALPRRRRSRGPAL